MNYTAFQEIINKIDGIISSKLVVNNDSLEEIHILANNLRSPKQIVRDIESSLLASYDYRVDRKVISIAQIQTDDHETIRRIKFAGVSINADESLAECCVKLLYEGQEYFVSQKGVKTMSKRKKLVAEATIKAVEQILGQPSIFDVQEVLIQTSGQVSFASVLITMILRDAEESMIGSAIVKNDINEAIAKAALDAVNRRVQKIDL